MNNPGSNRDEKLNTILDSGLKLLARDGLGFSMRELAKEAGFGGVSSIYRYVEHKRELWFSVVNREFAILKQQLDGIIMDPKLIDNKAILIAMCRKMLFFSREHFDKFKVMLLLEPPFSDRDPGKNEKNHDPGVYRNFLTIITRMQSGNQMAKDTSPYATTGLIWSMLLGAATAVSPLYDYMNQEIYPEELLKIFPNPREALHDMVIEKIEILYFSK